MLFLNVQRLFHNQCPVEEDLNSVLTRCGGDGGDIQLAVPHTVQEELGPGLGDRSGQIGEDITLAVPDDKEYIDLIAGALGPVGGVDDDGNPGAGSIGGGVGISGDVQIVPILLGGSGAETCAEVGRIHIVALECGGILGGITNGMPVIFRCAVKPTPSIAKEQESVDMTRMENVKLSIHGRHDPAVIHRARVVVDSVTALVVCDLLAQRYGTDFLREK